MIRISLVLRWLLLMLVSLVGTLSWADDSHDAHHEETEKARVGEKLAIKQASRHDGFELGQAAMARLGIQTTPVLTEQVTFDSSVLVSFQEEKGLYRLRGGRFKWIDLDTAQVKETAQRYQVKTSELKPGDQIVIKGGALLRIAELEAWGGSGDGHGH